MNPLSFKYEPNVRVGLSEGGNFGLTLKGNFDVYNSEGMIQYHPTDTDSYTEVSGLRIGRDFHWNRELTMRFAGAMSLIRKNDKSSLLINSVKAEKYLASVIGSEMSANASIEFLKAHAVISRSWLLRMLSPTRHSSSPKEITATRIMDWTQTDAHSMYDVCNDDHCQRYQGIDCETESSRKAVAETRGLVLTDTAGEIVDARFSKCCGGLTEVFSACWDDVDYNYLQTIDDPYCNPSRLERHGGTKVLKSFMKSYDMESADYFQWQEIVSPRLIETNLKKYYSVDVGNVTELNVMRRGSSGRIMELEIKGSTGSIVVGKELTVRRLLSESHLKSSNFNFTRTSSGQFLLRGKGWGHGVGLCQIGAATMALEGYDYRAILNHYYPGTSLLKVYE